MNRAIVQSWGDIPGYKHGEADHTQDRGEDVA